MDIKTKREQEKEIVSFMIALYCKKSTDIKHFVLNVQHWKLMQGNGVMHVLLWKVRLFVLTAGFIVIKKICGKKSGRLCDFQDPE